MVVLRLSAVGRQARQGPALPRRTPFAGIMQYIGESGAQKGYLKAAFGKYQSRLPQPCRLSVNDCLVRFPDPYKDHPSGSLARR